MLVYLEGIVNPVEIPRALVYVYFVIVALVTVALYVLRAIGLRTIAKRNGVKGGIWTVWVPFLWIYVACKIVSDMRLFGISFKTLAIIGLCLFSVFGTAYIIYNTIYYAPLVIYYLQGGEVIISSTALSGEYVKYLSPLNDIYVRVKPELISMTATGVRYFFPYANKLLFTDLYNVCINIVSYLSIFKVLAVCFVYSAIFRKYWIKHFMLGTLLSIFIEPMFSIFIFAIRKNDPARLVRVVRVMPDQMNYNQNSANEDAEPFKEFGKEKPKKNQDPGDPFADFWDKKD